MNCVLKRFYVLSWTGNDCETREISFSAICKFFITFAVVCCEQPEKSMRAQGCLLFVADHELSTWSPVLSQSLSNTVCIGSESRVRFSVSCGKIIVNLKIGDGAKSPKSCKILKGWP